MTIRSEIESRLLTWANAQTPKVPVSLEGVTFIKPTVAFIQITGLASNTVNPSIDAVRTRIRGVFQVNCWAKDGKGSKEVEELAKAIVGLFPVVPKIGTVSIEQTPDAGPALIENDWRIVPVIIKYRQEG